MGHNGQPKDAMIARLDRELSERTAAAQGLIANAQESERDLNQAEKETMTGLKERIVEIRSQLQELESFSELSSSVATRMEEVDRALSNNRRHGVTEIEYRSAGAYLVDHIAAQAGSRDAKERLEQYFRVAAHQKTPDNLGVIPDPIIGNVVNFIDAARPIVSTIGPMPLTSATWYRPKVTQHTLVGSQGTAGAASDEKAELDSQKMLITRLTGTAVTYGGYVNVSRQNIDFSTPQILDIVINDLAAQYAIQTEAATAALLATTGTAAVDYPLNPTADEAAAAIWEAVATVYTATKGQGRLVLALAPDRLGAFGPLFNPVNPQNAQSTGFSAGRFGQGVMGNIAGVDVVMSAGLASGEAFLFSTAAVEVFEQRVGSLQATEPSVLGVHVAYAGYFTPLMIEEDAVVPLEEGTA
jgi:HK97 family phage major capsid protein